jgi:hypothetical protein
MTLLTLNEFVTGLEYHEDLNPVLWNGDALLPDVRVALAKIASNFIEFLGIDRSMVTDVAITGSNCNYNYSPQSDIDMHVIAQYSPDHHNHLGIGVQSAFDSFKTLYNEERHISVHGFPIEVYVQPTSEHFTSNAGVYSLTKGTWIQHPVKTQVDLDSREIQRKAKPVMRDIDNIVHGKMASVVALPMIKSVKAKIKQLRAAGLEAGGEFGVENLAFKAIRNAGYLDKLSKYSEALKDSSLSL